MEDRLETAWLAHLEQHNSIFPEMDYHIYLDR
jgi:predicted glycosyl hydrolase (DUF1957 family)